MPPLVCLFPHYSTFRSLKNLLLKSPLFRFYGIIFTLLGSSFFTLILGWIWRVPPGNNILGIFTRRALIFVNVNWGELLFLWFGPSRDFWFGNVRYHARRSSFISFNWFFPSHLGSPFISFLSRGLAVSWLSWMASLLPLSILAYLCCKRELKVFVCWPCVWQPDEFSDSFLYLSMCLLHIYVNSYITCLHFSFQSLYRFLFFLLYLLGLPAQWNRNESGRICLILIFHTLRDHF